MSVQFSYSSNTLIEQLDVQYFSRLSQRVRADVPQQPRAEGEAVLVHDHRRDSGQIALPAAALSADGQHCLQG